MLRQEQYGWHDTRPAWSVLYAIVALFVAVVGLVEGFVESGGLRQILETVSVVAGFGFIRVWVGRNRIALELEQGRRRL